MYEVKLFDKENNLRALYTCGKMYPYIIRIKRYVNKPPCELSAYFMHVVDQKIMYNAFNNKNNNNNNENNEGIFIVLLHEVSQRLTLLHPLIRRINHS